MIYTVLDAIELVLKDLGEPLSPYWLASQMDERKFWKASEHDVRAALEKDMKEWGEKTQFVKLSDDEWGLRSWGES
jgi:DNA-directed RNA polymerase delta subunit